MVSSPILIPTIPNSLIQGILELGEYLKIALEYLFSFFGFIFDSLAFIAMIVPFLPPVIVISVSITAIIFVAKIMISILDVAL